MWSFKDNWLHKKNNRKLTTASLAFSVAVNLVKQLLLSGPKRFWCLEKSRTRLPRLQYSTKNGNFLHSETHTHTHAHAHVQPHTCMHISAPPSCSFVLKHRKTKSQKEQEARSMDAEKKRDENTQTLRTILDLLRGGFKTQAAALRHLLEEHKMKIPKQTFSRLVKVRKRTHISTHKYTSHTHIHYRQ